MHPRCTYSGGAPALTAHMSLLYGYGCGSRLEATQEPNCAWGTSISLVYRFAIVNSGADVHQWPSTRYRLVQALQKCGHLLQLPRLQNTLKQAKCKEKAEFPVLPMAPLY